MAVSIDNVYQKVLSFANKEQRGYITPQQFNLFADQAQLEILEQYFYDINQWSRQHGNDTEYSDMVTLINEKLALFKVSSSNLQGANGYVELPRGLYKIGTLSHTKFGGGSNRIIFEEVNYNDHKEMLASPLTAPTFKRPLFQNLNGQLKLYPDGFVASDIGLSYIEKPKTPKWAFVVVNNKTLYNSNISVDFRLHASEESELVYRILAYAGISIKKPELLQAASQGLSSQIQQEKQ